MTCLHCFPNVFTRSKLDFLNITYFHLFPFSLEKAFRRCSSKYSGLKACNFIELRLQQSPVNIGSF